jgi:hypothetical protein
MRNAFRAVSLLVPLGIALLSAALVGRMRRVAEEDGAFSENGYRTTAKTRTVPDYSIRVHRFPSNAMMSFRPMDHKTPSAELR